MTAWNGVGKGNVELKAEGNTLLFYERGSWQSPEQKEFEFSNVYRWTLKEEAGRIALEHLRFGAHYPVYLFDLIPSAPNALESVDAHLCKQDAYFGKARSDAHFIQLHWKVIGPGKNEEIDYLYT